MKVLSQVFTLIVVGLLIGCNIPTNEENHDGLPPVNSTDLVKVVIPLPINNNSRSVGLTEAKNNTNFFEVTFRKISAGIYVYYSAIATDDDDCIELQIPIGTYDILLFAGNKDVSFSPTPLLLASSFALNVNIVSTEKNIINMELNTIDININCPENVPIGDTFSISVEIDTKNPLIIIGSSNSTSGLGRLYIGDDINGTFLGYWRTDLTNNVLTFSPGTIASPLSVGTGLLKLEFSIMGMFENGVPFDYRGWGIAQYHHPTLGQYYQKSINFFDGQVMPEVEINITWPK